MTSLKVSARRNCGTERDKESERAREKERARERERESDGNVISKKKAGDMHKYV